VRALADPGPASPGRWVWGLSGLVTAAALIAGTALLITPAPDSPQNATAQPQFAQPQSVQPVGAPAQVAQAQAQATMTRTVTAPQPVTSLTVQSFGAPVRITGGATGRVQVTETISYDRSAGGPPPVTESVSGGHLLLADPACPDSGPSAAGCSVSFALIVPAGVSVAVVTGGGAAWLTFAAPPDSVSVSTGGGPATVSVPGGPYALTADSGGGPEIIEVATDPDAGRSITVSTAGGPLTVGP
jgi:hypothetical protein